MRIQGMNHITQAYGKQKSMAQDIKQVTRRDEATLSKMGQEIQNTYKLAMQTPDIRQDRVDMLKAQIQAGTYNVSAEEVSSKIISQIDLQG